MKEAAGTAKAAETISRAANHKEVCGGTEIQLKASRWGGK
jgi:hypothetical protein